MSQAAFLRAICAQPEQLTPRLVFADWLDEQGQPRAAAWAECIRAQCRLLELPIDHPAWLPTHLRSQALIARWGKGWLGPTRQHLRRWYFRAGLVESIVVDADVFLLHADAIVAATPVQQVRLVQVNRVAWPNLLATLARLRIPRLDLRHEPVTPFRLEELARSPYAAHLTALGLRGTGVSNTGGIQRFADFSTFPNLTELDLSDERISADRGGAGLDRYDTAQTDEYWDYRRQHAAAALRPADVQRFAESPHYPRLTALSLANHGAGVVRGLAGTPLLARLEALDVSGCVIADPTLFRSPVCQRLRHLNLGRIFAGNAEGVRRVVETVANSPALNGLRVLDLSGLNSRHGTHLHVAQILARGGGLERLAVLRLAGCQVDVDGVAALARAEWPHLRQLNLNENFFGNRGLLEMLGAAWLPQVQALGVSGPGSTLGRPDASWLDEQVAERLADAPLAALVSLDLSFQAISAANVVRWATAPALQALQALWLTGNRQNLAGSVAALVTAECWPQLQLLDVRGPTLPPDSTQRLRQRFGVGVRYGRAPSGQYRPAYWPADEVYDKYADATVSDVEANDW
jgi:uncharacterized protein (TIGR02996 family)